MANLIAVEELAGPAVLDGQTNCGIQPFDDRLREMFQRAQRCIGAVARYGPAAGLDVDDQVLQGNSWWCQIHRASQDLTALIPPGGAFLLIDGDARTTTETLAGRPCIPFLERDGQYWGPPPDDETAIRELERLRQSRANFMAFGWPAFWWLDCYAEVHRHLRSTFRCVLENDRLEVFDLRTPA